MINDNYKEGFVKACINRGLNADETEELCKLANYASAFNNKDFSDKFDELVVDGVKSANLSLVAKAYLAKSAVNKVFNS